MSHGLQDHDACFLWGNQEQQERDLEQKRVIGRGEIADLEMLLPAWGPLMLVRRNFAPNDTVHMP